MTKKKKKPEEKTNKKGVSYERVSTEDQAFELDGSLRLDGSTEAQRARCDYYVSHLTQKTGIPHTLVHRITDHAVSGKDTNRPGYQKLWKLIEYEKVDFVVAAELSRLSRSVIDFLEFVSHCEKHRVAIFIIGLELDTSTPFGRVIVIILVALAQFEREMTGVRVRENALARLLKDGKINGAAEILGLERDPQRRGHFIANPEELTKVEKLLKLFLIFSSKKKVLDEAKRLGLTGKNGRELNVFMLEQILENVRWRYRGQWLVPGKEGQIVNLPHGPLLNEDLLDEVQTALDNPNLKHTRNPDNVCYIYLLSRILKYQDGSKFTGESAKKNSYRYYRNAKHGIRIYCDQIEQLVLDKMKEHLLSIPRFVKLANKAMKGEINDTHKIFKSFLKKSPIDQRYLIEKVINRITITSSKEIIIELIKEEDKEATRTKELLFVE